jgi:3-hydroxyacyl-CoA dehydrogenase/enoyl-CoA hydratase/3-hydroxybutyryl-CoA epimerase
MELAEAGVPLVEIDRAAEAFGMPMGPVELVDSVGIDVALHVSKVLGGAMNRPVPQKLADMVEAGQLGRKSGQGFYRWENGKPVKPAAAGTAGGADIEDRLILPMVNEAVACLHDGVVTEADLLDAGVIFGTGFAPFRGGPINYARERGVDDVVARLNDFTQRYGERFTPHTGFSKI